MKAISLLSMAVLGLVAGVSGPVQADHGPGLNLAVSAMPAVYREECGACHLPFPPGTLSQADWQRTLDQLERHFGTDARVDAASQASLASFLKRYAGNPGRLGQAGDPPRLTRTAWFQRKHREVPARLWSAPAVQTPSRCQACHTKAAEGSFEEREISLPALTGSRR